MINDILERAAAVGAHRQSLRAELAAADYTLTMLCREYDTAEGTRGVRPESLVLLARKQFA
jgi:hypothetical protein